MWSLRCLMPECHKLPAFELPNQKCFVRVALSGLAMFNLLEVSPEVTSLRINSDADRLIFLGVDLLLCYDLLN